jgi:DNA-binding NtrC family response regulator
MREGAMTKILVASDQEYVTQGLKKIFELRGYKIITAKSGNEAIHLFHTKNPDILIQDAFRPEKDRLEAIIHIKARSPKAKIITISGGASHSKAFFLDMSKKLGAQYSFAKPLDLDKLLKAVEELSKKAC